MKINQPSRPENVPSSNSSASTAAARTAAVGDGYEAATNMPNISADGSVTLPNESGETVEDMQQQIVSLQTKVSGSNPAGDAKIWAAQIQLMVDEQNTMNASGGKASASTSIETPAPPAQVVQPATVTSSQSVPSGASTALTLSSKAPPQIAPLAGIINAAAQATGVPADLIGGIIYQESGGVSSVSSTTNPGTGLNDSGLMQVDAATATQLEQENPGQLNGLTGAARNVMLGALYLRDMNKLEGGDWEKTMRAYNSGPNDPSLKGGTVQFGDPTYITKVSAWWKAISTGQALPADHDPSAIT